MKPSGGIGIYSGMRRPQLSPKPPLPPLRQRDQPRGPGGPSPFPLLKGPLAPPPPAAPQKNPDDPALLRALVEKAQARKKEIPLEENACVVAAIANATGLAYNVAREAAVRNGYVKEVGMNFGEAHQALNDLGVKADYHRRQPKTWSGFPKKAIVAVRSPRGGYHAVVLEGNYIVDRAEGNMPVHRDNYSIVSRSSFIALDGTKQPPAAGGGK